MTPEKERELIEAIRDGLIAAWSARRMTKKTYASAGTIERRRWDECARAALSIAAPILRNDALGEAEAACKAIMLRQPAPEDPADQAHNYALEHACTRIRSLKPKDKPE